MKSALPHHLALGEADVERGEKFAQRLDLLRARLVVHAIDQRHARALQRLGRRHIGEDHELLDQPVRVEPRRGDHAIDRAVGLQQDLALGQVEVERLALGALALDGRVGRIERLDHRCEQGAGRLVGAAVGGVLRLRVVQLRGRAHQHAMERVAALAPVRADHHAHGERRAVLVRAQRAQIVRDALGQHRHDAVGEIDRIAAHQRLAVERGAGRHVVRDVGDRDA